PVGNLRFVSWKLWAARANCLRLFRHCARAAASRTFWTAGKSRPIKTAMMAITTSNSISVKPRRVFECRRRVIAYITFIGERGRESLGSTEPGSVESGSAETAYFFAFSYKLVESQTFTVLSKLAEARCFPSGLNATRLTTPV